jgi:hypothetical protein
MDPRERDDLEVGSRAADAFQRPSTPPPSAPAKAA